jgi:hypothetical protein
MLLSKPYHHINCKDKKFICLWFWSFQSKMDSSSVWASDMSLGSQWKGVHVRETAYTMSQDTERDHETSPTVPF